MVGRDSDTNLSRPICVFWIWYCSALNTILMLLNSKMKCTKLIYALFHPIYIYSLFNSELRLISYEITHFNMAFMQINTNSILNILNMDESGIL